MTFTLINENTKMMVMPVSLVVFGFIVCGDHAFGPNGAQEENLNGRSLEKWAKSGNRSNLSQCQSQCQSMRISLTSTSPTYDFLFANI